MVCRGSQATWKPPSCPEAMIPSTPASTHFLAALTEGTTCIQKRSEDFTRSLQGTGLPAEVTSTLSLLLISGSSSLTSRVALTISSAGSLTSSETITLSPKIPPDSLVLSSVRLKMFLRVSAGVGPSIPGSKVLLNIS